MNIDALNQIIRKKNKELEYEALMYGSDVKPMEYLSTGLFQLDRAIGGGWPMGRFSLLWGAYSTGKTTLCFWAIAKAQQQGKTCVFVDAERSFDPKWARLHGVDVDKLLVVQDNAEERITAVLKDMLQDQLIDLVVVDSLNAINTIKFLTDDNNSIGIHARTVGRFYSKVNAANRNTAFLIISQQRVDLSTRYAVLTPSGGNASDHYCSLMVKLSSHSKDKIEEDIQVGSKVISSFAGKSVRWEITKSKVSTPFLTGDFKLYQDGRSPLVSEIIGPAMEMGLVEKGGSWFTFDGEKYHGEDNLIDYLTKNTDKLEVLKNKVLEGN